MWRGVSTAASHRVNKHWAWSHKEQKQNGCVGVLRSRRTKCRERKPASHSNNSVPLTPSHHHAMTTEIWQLSGDAKTPRYQLERLERSQDKSRGVFRRQTTPNTPNTPSFHLFQLAYQSNRMTADSILKQHQSGAQMANGSRVAIKQHKEPDVSQDRYGQSWHLTEMDLGHFLKSSQHFLFFFIHLCAKFGYLLLFHEACVRLSFQQLGTNQGRSPEARMKRGHTYHILSAYMYELTPMSWGRGDGTEVCKPVTPVHDCVWTFVSVRPVDVFNETTEQIPTMFVATIDETIYTRGQGISRCVRGAKTIYFKPKYDSFRSLTKWFLCLNPNQTISTELSRQKVKKWT